MYFPAAYLTLKSAHTTSKKRPIALVSGPNIQKDDQSSVRQTATSGGIPNFEFAPFFETPENSCAVGVITDACATIPPGKYMISLKVGIGATIMENLATDGFVFSHVRAGR